MFRFSFFPIVLCFFSVSLFATEFPGVRFLADFPGASMGEVQVETGVPNTFRVSMRAQCDEKNLNSQATWFAFRLVPTQEREISEVRLVFWNFDGCYDGHPTHPSWKGALPVFSMDEGRTWTHFAQERCIWDEDARTMSLTVPLPKDGTEIRVAYTAMYTDREARLLAEAVKNSPRVRQETLGAGQTLYTITNFEVPETEKLRFFIMARQHAWEAHTSWQMDGLIRFLAGQSGIVPEFTDEKAAEIAEELCKKCVFYIVPIVDPLGVEKGWVRFNFLGYDVNRRWNEVNLNSEESRKTRPECWFVKQKILQLNDEKPLNLVLNLHGDTATDYSDACGPEELYEVFRTFENLMTETRLYDPLDRKPINIIRSEFGKEPPTTFALWWDQKIPTYMMEQKVSKNFRLGRFETQEDSQARGAWVGINLEKAFNGGEK